MGDGEIDPRRRIDPRVDSPGREGLTGTAPAMAYRPPVEADQVTLAPDARPWEEQPDWRKDFPIDAPMDHHFARREFMRFMVLISFSFAVGQLWIGVQNWMRRRHGRPEIRRIASLKEVPVGGAMTFTYPGDKDACILMRPEPGVLVAYVQKCTHLSCAVVPQPEKGRIFCPCHEGSFDIRSGRPLAGPPRRPLARIVLEVRGDDIYATGVEPRTI